MDLLNKKQAIILLHIAVLLFGFTAILGDLIQLKAIYLVWWRVLITIFSLLFFTGFGSKAFEIPRKEFLNFILIGFLIGIHWVCFYASIKLSNASTALICLSTVSFFTSIIEPFFTSHKWNKLDFLVGLLMVPCMYFIVSENNFVNIAGVVVGLLSSLLASIFTILNKKHMGNTNTLVVTFIEMIGVFILTTISIPFMIGHWSSLLPTMSDWIYLLILSIICTTCAWVISLKALKYVTAFEANIIVTLEPVYGVILALLLLNEHQKVSSNFYFGAFLIFIIAIGYPIFKSKSRMG